MEIVKLPNSLLREKSEQVKFPISKEDKELLLSMYQYVKENEEKAIGISAVQVGSLKRMCAIRFRRNDKLVSYQLVNPKIIWHSGDKFNLPGGEGCLSVDESHDNPIPRWSHIKVSAFDCIKNKTVVIDATNLESAVLQHEIDHMDGKLYIDYI